MADFNLGRIRFVWQGLWEPSRDYVRDDVVQETDSSFVCIEAHTSGSTFAENSDKFEIMARGASATPTTNVGDIVYRGNEGDERLPIGSTGESLLVDSSGVPEWSFPEADLSVKSTDDLSEGSNLYYTDTRARDAVSAAGDLSYDSATGTFLFAERTDSEVRNLFSAAGDLSYDSATGEFSIAQSVGYESTDFDDDFSSKTADDLSEGATNLYYTDTRVDSHLSGGTGVSYSSGTISIGQEVGTNDNVSFNDVNISGDLTVSGTTTTLNTTTLDVEDINITVANGATDAAAADGAGITADLGSDGDATFTYVSADDRWAMNKSLAADLIGDVTGTVSDISNHDTDDLSEGTTSLYYTDARVDSHLSGGTGVSYSSGSISIGQAVGTTDNVEFNDVAVNGSLTVSGGIDADTLDSQSPSFYLDYDNFTNTPPDPAALSFVSTLIFS